MYYAKVKNGTKLLKPMINEALTLIFSMLYRPAGYNVAVQYTFHRICNLIPPNKYLRCAFAWCFLPVFVPCCTHLTLLYYIQNMIWQRGTLGFRPSGRAGWTSVMNVTVAVGVGVVSGHYIFKEPLDEYWKEKLREENAATTKQDDVASSSKETEKK
jgi:hypothetical protein